MSTQPITIETIINSTRTKVWECWNKPEHISGWAFAVDDWEAFPKHNDLKVGGTFITTMAAKNKSVSFDFGGTYTVVKDQELIEYNMDDGRHVRVEFHEVPEGIHVVQTFDPEKENSEEMQRAGWQAILDNFKKYVEALKQ